MANSITIQFHQDITTISAIDEKFNSDNVLDLDSIKPVILDTTGFTDDEKTTLDNFIQLVNSKLNI